MKTEIILPLAIAGGFVVLYFMNEDSTPYSPPPKKGKPFEFIFTGKDAERRKYLLEHPEEVLSKLNIDKEIEESDKRQKLIQKELQRLEQREQEISRRAEQEKIEAKEALELIQRNKLLEIEYRKRLEADMSKSDIKKVELELRNLAQLEGESLEEFSQRKESLQQRFTELEKEKKAKEVIGGGFAQESPQKIIENPQISEELEKNIVIKRRKKGKNTLTKEGLSPNREGNEPDKNQN